MALHQARYRDTVEEPPHLRLPSPIPDAPPLGCSAACPFTSLFEAAPPSTNHQRPNLFATGTAYSLLSMFLTSPGSFLASVAMEGCSCWWQRRRPGEEVSQHRDLIFLTTTSSHCHNNGRLISSHNPRPSPSPNLTPTVGIVETTHLRDTDMEMLQLCTLLSGSRRTSTVLGERRCNAMPFRSQICLPSSTPLQLNKYLSSIVLNMFSKMLECLTYVHCHSHSAPCHCSLVNKCLIAYHFLG